jgi:hypothetical protein
MSQPENLGAFIKENKSLLSNYLETRLEIYRLSGIRASSKAVGYLIWVLVSLFLLLIVCIFVGLMIGFWLSDITGSNVKGFGLTALIFIVIFILMALMRNALFVNPAIKAIISKLQDNESEDVTEDSHF